MQYKTTNGSVSYKSGSARTKVRSGYSGACRTGNSGGVAYRIGGSSACYKMGGFGLGPLPSGNVENRKIVFQTTTIESKTTIYDNVITTTSISEPLTNYGQASLVPSNTPTTICSYIVPAGKVAFIRSFYGSGDADAHYSLHVGVTEERVLGGRSTPAELKLEVNLNPSYIQVAEGTTVCIKVLHLASVPIDFEGCIVGNLTDVV